MDQASQNCEMVEFRNIDDVCPECVKEISRKGAKIRRKEAEKSLKSSLRLCVRFAPLREPRFYFLPAAEA
jgi:hypothetical protein